MRLIALTAALAALAAPAVAQDHANHAGHAAHTRSALSATPPVHQEDAALAAAVASTSRTEADRARDVYRRPVESLTFWGLTPGATVVEVQPGANGWWTAILAPYAEATSGRYVPAADLAALEAVEPGSADMVLIARAFHNWARAGRTDAVLAAAFKALKPGGVLAVEQHRAVDGLNVADTASTGYVPESYVIRSAEAAGFALDARSELNANPNDDRDHTFGVWTLKPVRQSAGRDGANPLTPEQRAEYDAVGESDRMTLRFRKPEAAAGMQ